MVIFLFSLVCCPFVGATTCTAMPEKVKEVCSFYNFTSSEAKDLHHIKEVNRNTVIFDFTPLFASHCSPRFYFVPCYSRFVHHVMILFYCLVAMSAFLYTLPAIRCSKNTTKNGRTLLTAHLCQPSQVYVCRRHLLLLRCRHHLSLRCRHLCPLCRQMQVYLQSYNPAVLHPRSSQLLVLFLFLSFWFLDGSLYATYFVFITHLPMTPRTQSCTHHNTLLLFLRRTIHYHHQTFRHLHRRFHQKGKMFRFTRTLVHCTQ